MQDYAQRLDSLLVQLQLLLEEEFAENIAVKDAFNALACAIDEELGV